MLEHSIKAFVKLGVFLKNPENQPILDNWTHRAFSVNNWFTAINVQSSLNAIAENFCDETKFRQWVAGYDFEKVQ